MNILHLKYVVEAEKTRSISKAAENLYMGQPNLSRAIKELEEDLGITIFERTSKGIDLTPQGEEFMQYAKRIISQIDEVEAIYKSEKHEKQKFSVSLPRASYIAEAFTDFAAHIDTEKPAEIFYKETNSMRAVNNILQEDYHLGIIRYQDTFEPYFAAFLHDKGLKSELIYEFSYVALMSKNNPLSKKEELNTKDFSECIEIAHADPYVPSLPLIDSKKAELSEFVNKRIFVFERSSQMDLLSNVPKTFMWVSPIPKRLLDLYGLVERECKGNEKKYKDVLIYRKDYRLSTLDKKFLEILKKYKPQKNQEK